MITKENLQQIEHIGVGIDHDMAFGGKSKGNKHLYRVVVLTEHLAKSAKANVNIAIAGAWLHDTALPSGNDYNYENNKKIILDILHGVDLSNEDRLSIAECVASHEGTTEPQTLEAQVVHDADVLEKVGLLGIIRHTWKLTNSGKINPKQVTQDDVTAVLNHIQWRQERLHTDEAKRLSRLVGISLDNETALKIVSLTAHMASKGIITEVIAQELASIVSPEQYALLETQLIQGYLSKNDQNDDVE